MKTLLKNCRLVEDGTEVLRNILIEGSAIAVISEEAPPIDAGCKAIDLQGMHIIPGLIDAHVHARDLELSYKEDFSTAGRAAAAGGITTILDMPNTKPPTVTLESLAKKREAAKSCIVNYGFNFGGSFYAPGTASNKLFMNETTGSMVERDKTAQENFFRNSCILMVHAEGEQVQEAIGMAIKHRTPLYLCHISTARELDMIEEAKKKFRNIFVEVTPHHLFLTKSTEMKIGALAKMKPSLKENDDRLALWEGIRSGLVDTIGSDHAPHTLEEKKSKSGEPPSGVPGLETMLALLLDAVNKGLLTLTDVVRLTAKNPARIFRIHNKGFIKVGYDADLTIVDMKRTRKVLGKKLFTKCRWSPFEGMTLQGWPVMTIVNGNIVFEHGKINEGIKGKEVCIEEDLLM